jgi:glycosyltransferase involved in cell wall biosynthesis
MRKIKILFVSKHVVYNDIAEGGHKVFNYYLNQFCDDNDFEVGYLVVHKKDEAYQKMRNTFAKKAKDFSIYIPSFFRIFTYIYYKTFLRFLFSFIKAEWYFLDPIYDYYFKKALKNNVKKSGWVPDVVVFEWTEVIFLKRYYNKLFKHSYSFATEHDLTFVKLFRRFGDNKLIKQLFLNAFKKTELNTLKLFDTVLSLSFDDKKALEQNNILTEKILVISAYFQLVNKTQADLSNQIIFFGVMNRLENSEAVEWFIDDVFVPFNLAEKTSFIIIGAKVPKRLIVKYENTKGVIFTGFVEEPQKYFENALCMVVPLLNGGGIKIKILEAMSASVAVLTNELGIEGIPGISQKDYIYCSAAQDYYFNILNLLNNPLEAKRIGENGRKLILENFNFEESFKNYKKRIVNNITIINKHTS